MKPKRYPIQVWFLDADLAQSAQQHSDKLLNKSISGCFSTLCCARLYYIGIRSFTHYKYYFSKERKQETLDRFFPLWPLNVKPSFNAYKTRLSKWCRMCREHYDYIIQALRCLLDEYEYRNGKPHGMQKFYDWLTLDAPEIKIPVGNLKTISVPWKVLPLQYRQKDINAGYRAYCKSVLENDGIKISDFKKRDIPDWLTIKDDKWLD